jgi:hypothetical protein
VDARIIGNHARAKQKESAGGSRGAAVDHGRRRREPGGRRGRRAPRRRAGAAHLSGAPRALPGGARVGVRGRAYPHDGQWRAELRVALDQFARIAVLGPV